jgi:hypothetical protein
VARPDRVWLRNAFLVSAIAMGGGAGPLLGQHPSLPSSGQTLVSQASSVFSGEPSSTEGALTLLLPTGAQGVGLGRAMSAIPGPQSAFWNPAGLARLEEGHFIVMRGDHLAGDATAFSLILARQPIGVLGLSFQFLDLGSQDFRDGEGNVLGSVSFRDNLAIVSFSTPILPRLDIGLNFKVFQSRITCRGECSSVTGTSYALDAGFLSEPLAPIPLRLGLMVAHIGPNLQIINVEQADPLPTRLRAGVAYEVLHHFIDLPGVYLWLMGEMEDRWRALGSPVLYLGGETVVGEEDLFFVRAGYGQGQTGQAAGVSVGFGLRYERFELGIAKRLSGASLVGESEPVHVSFGVGF